MKRNEQLFREKWEGAASAAPVPAPATPAASVPGERNYRVRVAPGGGLLRHGRGRLEGAAEAAVLGQHRPFAESSRPRTHLGKVGPGLAERCRG